MDICCNKNKYLKSETKLRLDRYEVIRKIGQGSFGSVHLSVHRKSRKNLVIKEIRCVNLKYDVIDNVSWPAVTSSLSSKRIQFTQSWIMFFGNAKNRPIFVLSVLNPVSWTNFISIHPYSWLHIYAFYFQYQHKFFFNIAIPKPSCGGWVG